MCNYGIQRQINVQETDLVKDALKDIRSGMSDILIMRKYRIDSRGLQSLLRKLLQRGDLSPAEAEERITGMTQTQPLTEAEVQELAKEFAKGKTSKPAAPGERIVKAADLARVSGTEWTTTN